MARYKTTTDAIVFGVYRTAGEEFSGPDWADAYEWSMPDHVKRIDSPEAPGPDAGAPTVGKRAMRSK